MHNIIQDKMRKTLIANLSGNIDINQANIMLSDFKLKTSEINTKDYTLIINPENISANLFVIPILQSFIRLVTELNFKKIYLINSDKFASIIKQQLSNTKVAETLVFSSNLQQALKSI